ncbi:MAG: prepilin-type N-terminal cleavage/methylation domain-containing protein [Akkermansiaceae bacterium]|nr:prepilin-type N-terminal cleavage/methylation domain-containing protein [Akkermansiaceae bacterium]MCP5545530.1 prepilin-type N-terminal cleavage/methylation domain-containing protein [Akkermansiaceae bacterium]MCP5545763.1 prepilin-type N-terminal cleavage/methylation domain-containing protein [Akkermansiaceae bacterium]
MNAPHRRTRTRAAFTLLEVLVVVAVLVVLGALVFTGSRRLVSSARVVQSSANLRSLAAANATYLADHGVYCPADDRWNNRRWHGARSSSSGTFDPTKGFLSPYLGESRQVTVCPLFRAMVEGSSSFENGSGGYGYNAAYIGGLPGGAYDKDTKIRVSQRPANVTNPGHTVMFTTTAYARSTGLQEYPYCEPPFWDFGGGPSGSRPSPSVHFRANGKAIVAWCDGHVSTEVSNGVAGGANPHGGDAGELELGWFGPDDNNGYWNPAN